MEWDFPIPHRKVCGLEDGKLSSGYWLSGQEIRNDTQDSRQKNDPFRIEGWHEEVTHTWGS